LNTLESSRVVKTDDKLFLGTEFVTWLYFFLQEQNFEVELLLESQKATVAFSVGKRVLLRTVDGFGSRVALSGPGLDDSGELYQAVRRGAVIDLMALSMAIGERVYELVVHADGGISSLKLPTALKDSEDNEGASVGIDDTLSLRSAAFDDVESVLDGLFSIFLNRRLARAWVEHDLNVLRSRVGDALRSRLVS